MLFQIRVCLRSIYSHFMRWAQSHWIELSYNENVNCVYAIQICLHRFGIWFLPSIYSDSTSYSIVMRLIYVGVSLLCVCVFFLFNLHLLIAHSSNKYKNNSQPWAKLMQRTDEWKRKKKRATTNSVDWIIIISCCHCHRRADMIISNTNNTLSFHTTNKWHLSEFESEKYDYAIDWLWINIFKMADSD